MSSNVPERENSEFNIDVQSISFDVATTVHKSLVAKGVPDEKIDMNTVIEILTQVIAGYVSYVKSETGHNIEPQINNLIKESIIKFDSVYQAEKSKQVH